MKCKNAISNKECQDLIDYLETMRLTEETNKISEDSTYDEENEEVVDVVTSLNSPQIYGPNIPFLLYDKNNETIISRTAKGINEGNLNPYEVEWMEVTLYETMFVKQLLESIKSEFIMDVAQAIDDEEKIHEREDGQYTIVSSDFYGTGQGSNNFYSHSLNNRVDEIESIPSIVIAEGIIEKRKKAEAFKIKLETLKGRSINETEGTGEKIDNNQKETKQLLEECEKWKRKYEEANTKEPEKAFNAQTGSPCLTNTQMGILMLAVGIMTEQPAPAKTTIGEVVENICGYKATSVNQNMKGAHREADKEAVAKAIESKFPNLAAKIRKL